MRAKANKPIELQSSAASPDAEPQAETEARARLAAIVDSSSDAIISKDLNSVITTWNAAAERMFGYTAAEAVGQSVLMLIPERLHNEENEIIERIRNGERIGSFETLRLRKDGTPIHVSLTISPIKTADGKIIGASKIARDITATRENERRIRLLLREVNHRVKNQYAVILAMVKETSRRSTSPEEFERHVRDRIAALSRSHDLLVLSDWSGASVAELVQEHLKPFGHEERIKVSGSLLTLNARSVQYLGMALHELGTNSAKYGALACPKGSIEVTWKVVTDATGASVLQLSWEERFAGEPAACHQSNPRGFGSIVLLRATPQALDGSAEIDRGTGQVCWRLTAPVDSVTAVRDNEEEPALSQQVFDPIRLVRSLSLRNNMVPKAGQAEVGAMVANGAK
ncbi:MAG TPA: PAS domain S-box protein [Mesorhizobium sp.]|uniref:sensor histidine kinase n=1 Tax=Mesorhizobium sp. TaxID=1871066 RepID=UPI002DDD55E2|nr:PAS domain S-box protein [Mesorhizobium sp.]HEV2503269.1 PAS domain S-box protein [Mesorhizobium sp.]